MKLSKYLNLWLLLVLFLAAFVHFRWLSFDAFQYGDWRFHFAEVSKRFSELSPWDTFYTLGQPSIFLWKLPFNYLYGLFGAFGVDSNISEKLLVLWPTVFLPPLASFLLVRQICKSNLAAFAGSLVYSFNTYFFSINSAGHIFLTISAAFGIFALMFFIRAIQQQSISLYISAVLMGCLSVSYDIRMALIAATIALLYGLFFILVNSNKLYATKNLAKNLAFLGIVFVLLNCYWLLPIFFSSSLMTNPIMQRQVFGDQFLNILNAITLFHPFWTGGKPEWFVVQPIPLYLFVIPLLAFSGFLLRSRNSDVLFFGFIALIGILLGKQSGEPFNQLYHFLFASIPGFGAFREATKFDFMIALSYAVLVGSLVVKLNKMNTTKYARLLSYVACLAVLSVCVWNSKPIASGDIGTMFVERHVPDEYLRLKNYVLGDDEYSRVLWVPTDSPWEVNNDTHPTLSLASVVTDDWGSLFFNSPDSSKYGVMDRINVSLTQPNFQRMLSNSSIRYIVVPLRDIANDGDFYQYYGDSRGAFINKLNSLGVLHLLNSDATGTTVFENSKFRPHVYTTSEPETITREIAFHPIKLDVVNRSEYRIHLKNISLPIYLNFTDNHNFGWQIHLGSVSWWQTIIGKVSVLPDGVHTKSNAGLNSFYIDPDYIKKNYPGAFKVNVDGSLDIEMTLYYRSQAYLILGLIISLITLGGCLSYLMISSFLARIPFFNIILQKTNINRLLK